MKAPNVGIGLGTASGLVGAVTTFLLGVIALIDGNHEEATVAAIVSSAVILYGMIRGRMDQAVAVVRAEGEKAAAETTAAMPPVTPTPSVPTRVR